MAQAKLTGTERQIQWAEQIQAKFHAALWAEVEEANERVKIGDLPPVWAAAVYDATVAIGDSIAKDTRGQAQMWIDYRDRIMGYATQVKQLADKNCPVTVRTPALAQWRNELGL
jgi:hypothetical protein